MLNKNKLNQENKLALYSPEIITALLKILREEVAQTPTDVWTSTWYITKCLNDKLFSSNDQNNKRISGVKLGNLLRLLGFEKRRRLRLQTHVLVEQDILRRYENWVV